MLFCDTDLIVTKLWSEHYFGRCAEWIRAAAHTRHYDLHLQLDVDVPWVADAQRDQPHRREHFHELFRRELRAHACRVVEISGDWPARFEQAVVAVERVLDEPWPALGEGSAERMEIQRDSPLEHASRRARLHEGDVFLDAPRPATGPPRPRAPCRNTGRRDSRERSSGARQRQRRQPRNGPPTGLDDERHRADGDVDHD